jgi:predicted Zn-dependent protease with MMP-like domain
MTGGWTDRKAPSLEEFDALASNALSSLPAPFRALYGEIIVHVADFADNDILADLGIDDPFDLTGLFEGIDVTNRSIDDIPGGPNHVHLYRLPILAEWIEHGETTLGELVRHVLVHEIGHHFGLSDEDMDRIERRA